MRIIVILLLVIASNSVAANWVKIGHSADDGFDYYVDLVTIIKSENYVKMWVVYDYLRPQVLSGLQFLSTKLQFEYDCNEMKSRMLYASTHTGRMAGSDTIATVDNPNAGWGPVLLASVGERLWKYVCKKT